MLFKAGSAQALAQAVLQLLGQRERWPQLRRAGREFVELERNWRVSVGHYRKVYEALCARA
jgi:glycosyltransferase involved in cell wall biosynthesis